MAITKLIADSLGTGVGGKVLQVVSANFTTAESTTNSSFTGSTRRLSITPSSTSSKVYIIFTTAGANNNNSNHIAYTLYRETDSTHLGSSSEGFAQGYAGGGFGYWTVGINYLDSPSTTSAVEYRAYFKNGAGGTTAYMGRGDAKSVLTLMEIAG